MGQLDKVLLYGTVFITGAAVLVVEILGTRVISPFYGATIFVWTSLITATLGALAIGYYSGGKVADRHPQAQILSFIVLAAGLLCLLPIKIQQWALPATERFGLRFGPLLAALLLFFLPLVLMGMVTPFAVRIVTNDPTRTGRSAGRIFALATLGSIIGGLLAGFWLLSRFSLLQIFNGTGLLLILIGGVSLLSNRPITKLAGDGLFVVSGLAALLALMPPFTEPAKETFTVLSQRQSFFGDIKVVQLYSSRCLYVNGSGQTCVDSEGETDGFFQRFLRQELPRLDLDANNRVLLLGLGGGGILSLVPEDVLVDIVELDPAIIATAQEYFSFDRQKGNRSLIVDDARHFLATSSERKYDLIIENIALGNAVPAYILSQESFRDMRRLLKRNGTLLAHLGTHQIEKDNTFNTAVYSTAASVFPHVLALSSQPDTTANLILYLADHPITYSFAGEPRPSAIGFDPALVVTDAKNPLEGYYTSNAISQRQNTKPLGNHIFYVQ